MEETTLKQYIGTKTVKAEPMVKSAAVAKGWARLSEGWARLSEGCLNDPGYHVQYTNPDGSTYDSWSPKDVFEKSYEIAEDFKDRLEIEFKELRIRLLKLHKFIQDNGFANIAKKIGPEQGALLLSQYHGMSLYFDALKARLEILNSESEDK